ncbi:hypothetical protein [Streptomyces sp. NPDC059176]|uniref:hypothetical protein n=1 Tax=Streptomyces sp. NPDC059176 TaxID=3346758 RepID=UPI0036CA5C84
MSDAGVPLTKRPGSEPEREDDYSATVLASHWVERPAADGETVSETLREESAPTDTTTLREDEQPAGEPVTLREDGQPGGGTLRLGTEPPGRTLREETVPRSTVPGPVTATTVADVAPDVVEGTVLRFGPGVTAVVRARHERDEAATVWHGTLPGNTPLVQEGRRPSRLAGLRRYTLAAVVLIAVVGLLLWQRFGPGPTVRNVAVTVAPSVADCDGTAVITGLVDTDGRPGGLTYHWVRNDGTTSGDLHERLARGQTRAQLRLSWTFHGEGSFPARAELRVTSPTPHRAAVDFTYSCP